MEQFQIVQITIKSEVAKGVVKITVTKLKNDQLEPQIITIPTALNARAVVGSLDVHKSLVSQAYLLLVVSIANQIHGLFDPGSCCTYIGKISPVPTKLPATHRVKHHIDIQGSSPIRQAYRRLSPKVEESFNESAQKLKAEGIISPSKSEWCDPVVMLRKPDGDYRFCIDFRKLSEVAKEDAYPMRNINTILDKLSSARLSLRLT
ncbi:uncharacterized protein LOC117176597 [Belonocnema kinseyi]|uniref:uncharacterized protein LOC117176597 n=1 Tax=Belonocnema kinseyi TaxID=2817044 RepID=UPI00143DFAB2|nr:uncharacterized protein LOC117176597 [Belonocnema kinseyi]